MVTERLLKSFPRLYKLLAVCSLCALSPALPAAAQSGPSTVQKAPAATGKAATQPKRKFPIQFTSSLGFTQTRGNADARNLSAGNKLTYRSGGWVFQQDLSFVYGESNGRVSSNFWNGGLRLDRSVADRVALFAASRYDRNMPQGVTNRFQQGFGVNVAAMRDAHNSLNIALGGSLFSQQLVPGATAKVTRAFPAARAAMDYRYNFSKLAFMQHSAEYLPAVGDTATSFFFNSESTLVAPISKRIGVRLGYVVRYNSEPPIKKDIQLGTTDMFFSSGLTLTF